MPYNYFSSPIYLTGAPPKPSYQYDRDFKPICTACWRATATTWPPPWKHTVGVEICSTCGCETESGITVYIEPTEEAE